MKIRDEAELKMLLEQVDDELRKAGVPIPARPLRALLLISSRLGMAIAITPSTFQPRPGAYDGDNLGWHVNNWFTERYGDLLKINFGPGCTMVLVRGDAYRVNLPGVYGKVQIFCDPGTHGAKRSGREPSASWNVLDGIEGLQPALSETLTPAELQIIFDDICGAFVEFQEIAQFYSAGFGPQVKIDLRASVDAVLHIPPNYGISPWSSLQAAEKYLKTHLQHHGIPFPRGADGHDLHKLAAVVSNKVGSPALPAPLLSAAMCSPGVRYGEISSTLTEALEAHRAARRICAILATALSQSGPSASSGARRP